VNSASNLQLVLVSIDLSFETTFHLKDLTNESADLTKVFDVVEVAFLHAADYFSLVKAKYRALEF